MTPDDWLERARFDAALANRLWKGTAPTEDAPDWYGRVATLIRAAPAPATAEELAGESEVVARMQAAILDPAPADEPAGEFGIVARMQAAILGSAWAGDGDDVEGADRPQHLRAPVPVPPGVRLRQGARVARRIVAVKAAAVTTVVAIGVTAAAATTGLVATVVVPALSNRQPNAHEHKAPPYSDRGSSADSSGHSDDGEGGGAGGLVAPIDDPAKPLVCMINLECLLQKLETVTAAPAPPATPVTPTPAADAATLDAGAATEPPTTTTTTEPPPTTTTTEPPPTTTTTEPPPTTTTTEPPPPPDPPQEVASGPSPLAQTMSASTGETAAAGPAGAGAAGLTPAG